MRSCSSVEVRNGRRSPSVVDARGRTGHCWFESSPRHSDSLNLISPSRGGDGTGVLHAFFWSHDMTWDLRLGSCLDPLTGLASLADNSVDVTITDLAVGTAAEHLVCADLLIAGYHAFMAPQTCAYDVAVDVGGRLVRVQVKATRKPNELKRAARPAYMWHVRRAGKGGKRVYAPGEFDLLALVALDVRRVAYLPPSQHRQTVHIRTHGDGAPAGRSNVRGKTFEQLTFAKAINEVLR